MSTKNAVLWLQYMLVLAGFVATGWLSGWVVGASQSPVAGAFLPLVVGLLGTFTYTMADRFSRAKSIDDQIDRLELSQDYAKKVKEILDIPQKTEWVPGFWGVAIVAFCISCQFAVGCGAQRKTPHVYGLIESVVPTLKDQAFTPTDKAKLHNLYWRLRGQKLSEDEIADVFNSTVIPAAKLRPVVESQNKVASELQKKLEDIINKLQTEFFDKRLMSFDSEYHATVARELFAISKALEPQRDPLDRAIDSLMSSFSPIEPGSLMSPAFTPIITSEKE